MKRLPGGGIEEPFEYRDTLLGREKETEISRSYYPSGSVSDERLRIYEKETRTPLQLPGSSSGVGCLSAIFGGWSILLIGLLPGWIWPGSAWWIPWVAVAVWMMHSVAVSRR